MLSAQMQRLVDAVESRFGRVRAYGGDADDGHATSFRLEGAPARFSIHTQEGALPEGHYDVQIEGVPPGEYLYTDIVTLESFLELVRRVHGPEEQWPRVRQ